MISVIRLFCLFWFIGILALSSSSQNDREVAKRVNQYDSIGMKHGYWICNLKRNFKPSKNDDASYFTVLIYYDHGKRLTPNFKLSYGLQRRQILYDTLEERLEHPILLDGRYEFMRGNFKRSYLDLIFEKGVIRSSVIFSIDDESYSTLEYIDGENGRPSFVYDIAFTEESIPWKYVLWKIIDDKNWTIVEESEKPIENITYSELQSRY